MKSTESLGVLVIEDDADTRANLTDILELDGYSVDTVATVAEALAIVDWGNIAVVILDRKLPDGSAEQLLPQLRHIAPHAAVIVATGYADVEGAITAIRHGATDYLLKPIRPEILRATLGRIAERQRLTREKERSETAFRTMVEMSPCIVVILRLPGRIAYFNRFAEELTGFSPEEVLAENYCDRFLIVEERAHVEERLKQLGQQIPVRGLENVIRCRDGSHRAIVWNANYLADYEGEPALLIVALDITEHRRAEQRALQSQRLAAIGEAMTGLIHESRNALQRSTACLEMLAIEVEDRPNAMDYVRRIQRAQQHLQHLYEEVRSYAAPLKLQLRKTDLSELAREVWYDLGSLREGRNLRMKEELNGVDPNCRVDPFAMGQVWRNILENAIHVSPEGGQVTIRWAESLVEGQPAVRVAFLDQGPGIPADQRQRIFEPFFTTKTKGTGLGMAIAQRIIQSHGGHIAIAESPESGAEIILVIPRGLE